MCNRVESILCDFFPIFKVLEFCLIYIHLNEAIFVGFFFFEQVTLLEVYFGGVEASKMMSNTKHRLHPFFLQW